MSVHSVVPALVLPPVNVPGFAPPPLFEAPPVVVFTVLLAPVPPVLVSAECSELPHASKHVMENTLANRIRFVIGTGIILFIGDAAPGVSDGEHRLLTTHEVFNRNENHQ